ncbi:hypothetical protein HaLaN_04983, partial [Haematococcus lacustris]
MRGCGFWSARESGAAGGGKAWLIPQAVLGRL